jgi:hypothetical protein
MLVAENKYRLGEFIIIEHRGVLLTWVTHSALGNQRSGQCFSVGNILVIGPWEHEESGYLKLEFHELLMKLPAWDKTSYYCFASSLHQVDTGQSRAGDFIEHLLSQKIDTAAVTITSPGTFRLGRYEIITDENSIISWRTFEERNRIIRGTCVIEAGILYLGPKEDELDEGQGRQKFFTRLKLLSQWDKTFAWGYSGSLMKCKQPEPRKSFAAFWNPEYGNRWIINSMPRVQNQELREERISENRASGFQLLKTAWHHVVTWKGWNRLSPMILSGIFWGVRNLVFVVGKIAHFICGLRERFRIHCAK